jgi:hypothetical protein
MGLIQRPQYVLKTIQIARIVRSLLLQLYFKRKTSKVSSYFMYIVYITSDNIESVS